MRIEALGGNNYLLNELLVHGKISTWAVKGLLEEGKQDGDNDGSLDRLAEDDEENGN